MELEKALVSRRSIRKFKSSDVDDDKIKHILELANAAPSAGNVQARDFIIVRSRKIKVALAEAALNQDFIAAAPVVVIVCGNKGRSESYYGNRGRELYYIQDADAAIQNLLLAVHGNGLGACWIGAFNENAVSKILELPDDIRPLAIIPIGIPVSTRVRSSRIKIERLLHYEKW